MSQRPYGVEQLVDERRHPLARVRVGKTKSPKGGYWARVYVRSEENKKRKKRAEDAVVAISTILRCVRLEVVGMRKVFGKVGEDLESKTM